jgi:hypothetical protein
MEVSFVKNPTVESVTTVGGQVAEVRTDKEAEIVNQAVAVIPQAPALPAARHEDPPPFYDDENIGFSDIRLPRINIVQKVGELSNVFTPGEIVLNQTLPIYTPPVVKDGKEIKAGDKPLNIVLVGFRKKQFVEKIVGGTMGALCNSEEEVGKLGGTLNYKEHETKVANKIPSKLFQELATALILIEKPEAFKDVDHVEFAHEIEGRYYALALWSMKGSSYTTAAKTFFTARKMGHLKDIRENGVVTGGGYPSWSWALSTKLEAYKTGNFAHIPVLARGAKSSPAFLDFVRSLVGSTR